MCGVWKAVAIKPDTCECVTTPIHTFWGMWRPKGVNQCGNTFTHVRLNCSSLSKASESCIISEAEGFNIPIEGQPTYEYFMEMYDYTNFIWLATKSFVPKLLCAVSNDTVVSRDSTIVKQLPSSTMCELV